MSLAVRIIPTILNRHSQMVKGKHFKADRIVGHAMQAAKVHAMRGVDELMILDITATKEGREPDYNAIEELSDKCFSSLTVGGGVKTVDHVRKLLKAGADKICIGKASQNSRMLEKLSDKFGSQCITVSIDFPIVGYDPSDSKLERIIYTQLWAAFIEARGAGEILLQSIERDGTMQGYDLDLIREVSEAVNIPVIASGGCGTPQHALEAIQAGASAVAIGAMFSFTDYTPRNTANYLSEHGVTVRLH